MKIQETKLSSGYIVRHPFEYHVKISREGSSDEMLDALSKCRDNYRAAILTDDLLIEAKIEIEKLRAENKFLLKQLESYNAD